MPINTDFIQLELTKKAQSNADVILTWIERVKTLEANRAAKGITQVDDAVLQAEGQTATQHLTGADVTAGFVAANTIVAAIEAITGVEDLLEDLRKLTDDVGV